MVQVPAVNRVTVLLETVQTDSVCEVKVTVKAEEAEAVSERVPADNGVSAGCVKVIV